MGADSERSPDTEGPHNTKSGINRSQLSAGREEEPLSNIPTTPIEVSWLGPSFAVILQLVAAAVIAIFAFVGIWLQHDAETFGQPPIPTAARIGYITGLTVLATLIASFTSGQIRTLWLIYILKRPRSEPLAPRDRRRTSALVGQARLLDKVKAWPISITFLITGLITTAIVAGLSLSDDNYSQQFSITLSTDYSSKDFVNSGDTCVVTDDNELSSEFVWTLSNGSTMAVDMSEGTRCEPQTAKAILLDPIRKLFGSSYAYAVGGVPIGRDAIGVPVGGGEVSLGSYYLSIVFGIGLSQPSLAHLQSSTNCVPVLIENPVKCEASGNVTVSQNLVQVNAGGCTISNPVYAVDPNTQGATAAGACTNGSRVGSATVVIGSVNSHASILAGLMKDWQYNATEQSFSIACTVDIAPSVAFRQLNYCLNNVNILDTLHGVCSPYHVVGEGNSTCVPIGGNSTDYLQASGPPTLIDLNQMLTDTALATAASASWPLLQENRYSDGWLETLYEYSATGSLAFNGSRNQIEDTLGLASGIALGLFFGRGYGSQVYIDNGLIEFTGVRFGPGEWWTIFYTLPSLFSMLVLSILLWKVRRSLSSPWKAWRRDAPSYK